MVVLDLGPLGARRTELPERFFRLLEDLPPTSVLVALQTIDYDTVVRGRRGAASSEDFARAHTELSPLFRWVQDHPQQAVAREHRTPRGAAFERWAVERSRRYGAELELPAAAALREFTGENTLLADQELRKLAAYVDGQRPIGSADLELLTPFYGETDVFAMVESVGGHDAGKAMRLLQQLLAEEDPRYVFSMVVRQFRLLLLARQALDRGLAPRQVLVESPYRLPGFAADRIGRQALGFSFDRLADVYRQLLALDIASKTGRGDLTLGLETLVASLSG
jgi:DNA polymerase-3 subunit delta